MKVLLNLLFLVPGETGGLETYARGLLPEVVRAANSSDEFIAVISADARDTDLLTGNPSIRAIELPVRSRRREQWLLAEQMLLPWIVRREAPDVVHNLTSTGPVVGRVPMVTTTHDLAYHTAPDAAAGIKGRVMRAIAPRVAQQSRVVITVSEYSREQLVDLADIDPEQVVVIPNGVDDPIDPGDTAVFEARTRMTLVDRRVALFPGAFRPYKNAASLLRAIATIPRAIRPVAVLTGHGPECESELRLLVDELGIGADVRFAGWVDQWEMECLYRISDVVVFPSLHEGFGLPVAEAMARGVPVACSNTTSLPEVGGDSPRYFDPLRVEEIAASITETLVDSDLRAMMIARGLERARRYSWERAGAETYTCYRRAVGEFSG